MTEHAPKDCPLLTQVETLPFQQVRLTLADGQAVTLDLEAVRGAVLYSPPGQPVKVFTADYKDHDAPTWRVPAKLCPALRAAFFLCQVGA